MSPSEPSTPGSPGRRRKNSESDEQRNQADPSRTGGRRRSGGRRKKEPRRFGRTLTILVGSLVVALIALGVVLFVQLRGDEGEQAAAQETRPAVYKIRDAGNMNETP